VRPALESVRARRARLLLRRRDNSGGAVLRPQAFGATARVRERGGEHQGGEHDAGHG
jgi:hypothetical protein